MTNNLLDGLSVPPPSPSELDELISRDPLELSAADIDKIIAMQRSYRAKREVGTKKTKASAPGHDGPKIDLATALGLVKPTNTITPSTGGGLRRI